MTINENRDKEKPITIRWLLDGSTVMEDGLVPIAQISLQVGVVVVDFGIVRHGPQSGSVRMPKT